MTRDGRGRGLYSTQEIRSEQLLLVSNAVAVACESDSTAVYHVDNRRELNSTSQEELVAAVVCAARKSQRLLRQLYSLFDSSTPSSLHVPAIVLFKTDDQILAGQEVENEILQVELTVFDLRERKKSMFWLLPSLINHSCLPNSGFLVLGNGLFIHASKPIGRGEEITIPYCDVLVPLSQRQAKCKNWGFKCKCRRCILEHSFRKSLDPIIRSRFEQLNEKAKELMFAAKSQQQQLDMNILEHAEFARLFQGAEEIIKSSHLLKSEEEKLWIRASFSSAYLLSTTLNCFSGDKLNEAVQSTVPGDLRNLLAAGSKLKSFQHSMADEKEARRASDEAREACISVFGRQSEDVLNVLVLVFSK